MKPRFVGAVSLVLGLLATSAFGFPWPSRARAIENALQNGTPGEQRAALADLKELSPAMARRPVELALASADRDVQLEGARAAAQFGFADLGARVVPWLKVADVELERAAVELIALDPGLDAVAPLARLLASTDPALRGAAVRALGRVGPGQADEASQALGRGLDDRESRIRATVVEALGRIDPGAHVLALGLRLGDDEVDVRRRAAVALGAIADARAEPALLSALEDREDDVRTLVVVALGQLTTAGARAALERESRREPWGPSNDAAVEGLGRFEAPAVTAHLVRLLGRPEAAKLVEEVLRNRTSDARPELRKCLENAAAAELSACARSWCALGGPSEALLGPVRAGRIEEARALGLLAAGQSPDEDAIVFALERLDHGDPSARAAARALLRRVDHWEPAFRVPVRAALAARGLSGGERAELLVLLAGDDSAATLRIAALYENATDPAVRAAAAQVKFRARPADGLSWLEQPATARAVALDAASHGLSIEAARLLLAEYSTLGSNERTAVRVALSGLGRDAPTEVVEALIAATRGRFGREGSELLALLAVQQRAGDYLLERARRGDVGERTALAQWAAGRPEARLAQALLGDSDPTVHALALQSLGALGVTPDRKLLDAPSRRERLGAQSALLLALNSGASVDSTVVAACASDARRSSRDAAERILALGCTAALRGPRTFEFAERALRLDPHPEVRRAAARVLSHLDSPDARRALRVCAVYEADEAVAAACTPTPSARSLATERRSGSLWIELVASDGARRLAHQAVAWFSASGLVFGFSGADALLPEPPGALGLAEPGLSF